MPDRVNSHAAPVAELVRTIEQSGPVTFARFMESALYHPDGGYYMSDAAGGRDRGVWGHGGDYITNLDISPVFAAMLARQVHEMWSLIGSPGRFHIVDAGAGRGLLAIGLLDSIEEHYPALYRACFAWLVEKNPSLRRDPLEKVSWVGDLSEIDGPITGCIISNELLDALPFHRVVQRGELREVYVGLDDKAFIDVEGSPSTPELASYFGGLGITLTQGQHAEACLEASEWIKKAGGLLQRGYVVTIDYGLPSTALYEPGRQGNLMCYYRHTMNDDPYRNVGSQDITTHVDFSALKYAGETVGLETTGFTRQRNFLLGLGIAGELEQVPEPALDCYEALRYNQSIKDLIMPGGPGDTFKVLVQHKGVERPVLKGFSFKDDSKLL